MMGPTLSSFSFGCGNQEEENTEDSLEDQEVKEETITVNGHLTPEKATVREHRALPKTTPDSINPLPDLSVCPSSEEIIGNSCIARDKVEQGSDSEAVVENLDVGLNTQLTETTVVSTCSQTTESCHASLDIDSTSTGPDTPPASVHTETEPDLNTLSVSPVHTSLETPSDCGKEETPVRTDCGKEESAVRTDCGKEESAVRTDCDKEESAVRTDCGKEESAVRTDCGKEESAVRTDSHTEESAVKTDSHTEVSAVRTDSHTEDTAIIQTTKAVVGFAETADSTVTESLPCHSQTMATDAAQPMVEVIPPPEASMDPATTPEETLFAVNKAPETDSAPVEDRLSPEPSEGSGATVGSAKAAGGSGSESNGASAAATGGCENKSEQDGKTVAAKTKKKEDKSIEYILRALSSLNSPEEKLAALCKKYADLHEEHRVLQSSFKQQQRKMTVGQREKDQLQAEHTKAVIAKSKLESLCRELQKQNKAVKEESILRQKEEEERRKEISAKFQTTIAEIQTQMTENHEKNVKLREENHDLACRLKTFLEQQDLREQQLDKLHKHRELENQLSEAKLQQATAVMKEHEEKHLKEKELLLLQTAEAQKKNAMLDAQLNMYKDRYEEFQGTINKSNDMFQKLKAEMDKMGKRIKKLEKEGAQWRAKWEASNKALLDMAEEKTRSDKEKQLLQTKIIKLESLCRALQGEMHGKKSASPQPTSSEESSKNTLASAPVENAAASNAPASTTTTPPNTPEENTSRASPNPDSPASLPQSLPTGQNGPINASASTPVLDSSTEVESESPAEACHAAEAASLVEENAATVGSESPSSCQEVSVPSAAAQEPDEAETSSSTADLPGSADQEEGV